MAEVKTAKEQYDELIADLKAGTHRSLDKDRPVLVWDEYDVEPGAVRAEARVASDGSIVSAAVPHPYAGKHMVTVQYGGHAGGDGGLLRDYAFDPEQIKAAEKAKPAKAEKEPAPEVPVKGAKGDGGKQ